MGITDAVKNLVSGNSDPSADLGPGDSTSTARRGGSRKHKLPPGTGPGTSGKPAPETLNAYDREQGIERGAGGYAGKERKTGIEQTATGIRTADHGITTVVSTAPGQAAPVTSADFDRERLTRGESERSSLSSAFFEDKHKRGHSEHDDPVAMPSGATQEDTNQLNPVTHERVHFLETEEIQRVKDVHRHVHHIQHHIQPVIASEHLTEQISDFVHPITKVREIHANKDADNALFQGQVHEHQDTYRELAKERTIIDKGVAIKEHVHHHVHHVIQPIIEKETYDRRRIRTVIPIQEVTQEAPIVHRAQTHSAVPIEHFLQRGGILHNAISPGDIATRVLHRGQCSREVDGVADSLARELKLSDETTHEPATTKTIPSQVQTHPQRDEMLAGPKHEMPRPQVETESDAPVTMPMASIN